MESLSDRGEDDRFALYIGCMISCEGYVIQQRPITIYPQPYTPMERTQIVLKDVTMAGIKCDHICLLNCDELNGVKEGDKVSVVGYLKRYKAKGDQSKYGLRFPYTNVRVFRQEKTE